MANTIEVQVTTTTTRTEVVNLPYCTKSATGTYYDKITPEGTIRIEPKNLCIKVFNFHSTNDIVISEDEFDAKFNEVIASLIIKNLNK